jgi:integrase
VSVLLHTPRPTGPGLWRWPLDPAAYDRAPALDEAEIAALARRFDRPSCQVKRPTREEVRRLVRPIDDVLAFGQAAQDVRYDVVRFMLLEMYCRRRTFWAWTTAEWVESICPDAASFARRQGRGRRGNLYQARRYLPLLAYLLCPPPDIDAILALFKPHPLALKLFGQPAIDAAVGRLLEILRTWGYREGPTPREQVTTTACYLLLLNRHPALEALTDEVVARVAAACPLPSVQRRIFQVSRALVALGITTRAVPEARGSIGRTVSDTDGRIDADWLAWCRRWRAHTTMQRPGGYYYQLLKVGRWLAAHHPEVTGPGDWSYELAAEFVAAVNAMAVGEWSAEAYRPRLGAARLGRPLHAVSKNRLLGALRSFLRDCQEWGWVPVRLNPQRALRTPRAVRALIGPDPRVIDHDRWVKVLWAALNLDEGDLPCIAGRTPVYPLEMVRALAAVWCFAALRSDEIGRLRVGCVRWQREDTMVPETGAVLPKDAVCFLDVPVNKTSTAYTKPVHPLVGARIAEWERVRAAEQPRAVDRKTGEAVHFLFAHRGRRVSHRYVNAVLIPLLCRKAGIPARDSRGAITSHRARATIASLLYNAKDPLDVFELKEYLGHKYLSSTQHYLRVNPTKLASKVAQTGYLEQNLATVEVLLDQDAVLNGAAARGEAWKFYDLGHGYCTHAFWAECRHRMACARCPFYRPKQTTADHLIEGKANLIRMLEFITLTEDERALVEEGIELHQALIDKLADVPTPAGPTPRDLAARGRQLPVVPSAGGEADT